MPDVSQRKLYKAATEHVCIRTRTLTGSEFLLDLLLVDVSAIISSLLAIHINLLQGFQACVGSVHQQL
jgi:hypothetical protein